MSIEQMSFYQRKLAYEMDSADVSEALANGEPRFGGRWLTGVVAPSAVAPGRCP